MLKSNKILSLFIFFGLFIPSLVFAGTVTINVTPATTYTGCTFNVYNAATNTLITNYNPINTDSSGVWGPYNIPPAGNYKFGLKIPGYAEVYADNQNTLSLATSFTVNSSSKTNIYFTRPASVGHYVSGTVRNRAGTALSGIKVHLFDVNDNWLNYATTNGSGYFRFNDLSGTYYIKTEDTTGTYYDLWYGNAFGNSDRSSVVVGGSDLTGYDFSLYSKATISGSLTDADSGLPISGVDVKVFLRSAAFTWVTQNLNCNGSFTIKIPAGVNLMVRASASGYPDLYFNQAGSWPTSTTVNLAAGATSSNINFSMQHAFTVSGTVQNRSGTNLNNIRIDVFNASNTWLTSVSSNAGNYTVTLNNGTYYFKASDPSGGLYFQQFYNQAYGDSDRTSIVVSGANLTGRNFSLYRNATVSGTVRDFDTLANLSNVGVYAFLRGSAFTYVTRVTANTGSYSLTVPAGVPLMIKTSTSNYPDVFYNQVSGWTTSTTVNVGPGATSSNINFLLQRFWTISGTVRNRSGSALNGIRVNLYNNTGAFIRSATSNASGIFTVSANNGTYYVQAVDLAGGLYFTQYYNQAYGDADRSAVTVSNANRIGIDFSLYRNATISGTITDDSSSPLNNVALMTFVRGSAFLWVAQVTANGSYTLTVPAGVNLMVRATKASYQTTFYNQATVWSQSRTVNVMAGGTSANINLQLFQTWTISGNVRLNGGGSPAGTTVEFFTYNNWGSYFGQAIAAANGHYEISGTGNHTFMVRYSRANYVSKIYPNLIYFSDLSLSNRVTTDATMGVKNLQNVTLFQSGSISGTITAYGGAAAGTVTINVEDPNGKYFTSATRSGSGTYTINSIPTGNWKVKALKQSCVSEYYGETTSTRDATTINVTQGSTVSGVNIEIGLPWAVTGQIKIRGSSTPIVGARVTAYKYQAGWHYMDSATTNAQGYYIIDQGFNTGNVFLQASASGYRTLLWNDHPTGDWNVSNLINMRPGTTTINFNFNLYQTGTVNGTVVYDTGGNVSGAVVIIYDTPGHSQLATGRTNASGAYSIGGVIPGNLKVLVTANTCRSEYYNNVPQDLANSWGLATTISVSSGGTVSGINFGLERRWRIGGYISTSDGSSPAGADAVYNIIGWTPVTVSVGATGYYEYWSTKNITNPLIITFSKTNYYPVTRSCTVVLGTTDWTTLNITLLAMEEPLPDWYTNVEDSMRTGPNPANPEDGPVHIGFVVEEDSSARLAIYSLGGELVFSDSKRVSRGYNEFLWKGDDRFSQTVANGVYLGYLEVKTGNKTYKKVLKMAILR